MNVSGGVKRSHCEYSFLGCFELIIDHSKIPAIGHEHGLVQRDAISCIGHLWHGIELETLQIPISACDCLLCLLCT